jgi:cytochrome c peroxidase
MRTTRYPVALIILMAGLSFAPREVIAVSLQITIRNTFKGEPLLLDSLRYQNARGERLSVTRLSYLLSGFALERADGIWVDLPDQFAWMDAAQRRTFVRFDGLPVGVYRSLRFHVGLNSAANRSDPTKFAADHPLNPNLNGLHWSWQGGYIFMALEGLYRASTSSEPSGFAYHFARDTNCTCINLAAQLDLAHDVQVQVDFDVAALLNAPSPLSFSTDGSSTHSRDGDPIARALAANLPGAFRVRQIDSATARIAKNKPVRPLYLPEMFTPYRFQINGTFPIPDLPHDNPLIEERVALGENLFRETALSRDGTLSCASCHRASAAFADPRRYSVGVREQVGTRNAMPLFNLAWKSSFFWDGRAPSLRTQALMPVQDHTEMDESLTNVVAKLSGGVGKSPATESQADYRKLFIAAFGSPEITVEKIGLAIESFLLTLTSCDSKFDRVMRGGERLEAQEQRGFELFMTEYEPRTGQYGADCFHCHGGALFSDHQFHNNGLGLNDADLGRFKVTKLEADKGKFSTPSLRNVALTAPYMHDGRFATLEEVVEHYSSGVKRDATLDPNLAKHPGSGLHLSAEDKHALVAFLKTLTDPKFDQRKTMAQLH